MSFLTSLLGISNPAQAAGPDLSQITPMMQNYYNPYVGPNQQNYNQYANQVQGLLGQYPNVNNQFNQLTGALPQLQGQYGNLTGGGQQLQNQYQQAAANPGQTINQIGSNYTPSPGYQFSLNQALMAGNNTNAAGGLSGSPQNQQQNQSTAVGLANQDYYNYLQNALGVYGTGLQGSQNLYGTGLQGQQGLYNTGIQGQTGLYGAGLEGSGGLNQQSYNATTGLAQNLASSLLSQANLAYAGQANQNQMTGGLFGGLLSAFGQGGALNGLFGGGAAGGASSAAFGGVGSDITSGLLL